MAQFWVWFLFMSNCFYQKVQPFFLAAQYTFMESQFTLWPLGFEMNLMRIQIRGTAFASTTYITFSANDHTFVHFLFWWLMSCLTLQTWYKFNKGLTCVILITFRVSSFGPLKYSNFDFIIFFGLGQLNIDVRTTDRFLVTSFAHEFLHFQVEQAKLV